MQFSIEQVAALLGLQSGGASEMPAIPLKSAMPKPTQAERPVIVTTAHRGVFFGYATDIDSDVIELKRARLAVYWSSDCKGFMGLASTGPTAGCRIGPPADINLRNITAVLSVTDEAVKAWESAPWKS